MNDIVDVVKTGLADVEAKFQSQLKELRNEVGDLAQKSGSPAGFGQVATKGVAVKVSEDTQLAALRDRTTKSVSIPMNESVAMLRKSVVGDAGGVEDSPYNVQPNRAPGMFNDPRRPLSLLDLMQRIGVSSNSFEFTALDGFVDAAGYQLAEGDAKPSQDLPTDLKTAPIVTIAVVMAASEQVLADAPQLQQFINGRLIHGVSQKLESELINGAGGTGQINGLINQATTFTPTAGSASADAIGEAASSLVAAGWNPGAIVMHPSDWHTIRSERTTAGEYVTTGWDSPAGPNVWGVPVVASAAMTQGTVIVMDTMQVALLDRMSARFELGYAGDDFINNMLRMRAELRAGLAVFAPSAVLKLTVPPAAA
ncbi:phage major capsid protein [Halomonas sp. AOP42-D1-22]|uniref:phage major capsid protein n=1 Tax=Halomonas sp. AOP42-D1-22 TaxID=3457667 RepID=UPI004034047A